MAVRFLVSVMMVTLCLGGLPALPAGAQPAAPSGPPGAPAPVPPAQAPTLSEIPTIPPIPVAPPRTLSLADAVTAGLQNSFQIRQAALQLTLARAQLREAEGGKQLTLGGQASLTTNSLGGQPLAGSISIGGAPNQPFTTSGLSGSGTPSQLWQFGLTLRYPLYTGGALEAQIEIARANVAIAEAQFTAAAEQVVLAVRQAYYGLEQAQGAVEAAQRAVDAARENARVTDARVRVGTSPQFDLLQAQVQLAQSEQALTRARTGAVQSQQSLAAVLSLPLTTTVAPATPLGLQPPPGDVETLTQQALRNRPEVAQVRASLVAAQAAIDLAASGLKPNIALTGGPQLQTSDLTRGSVNWTAAIVATLAIFDGGVTQARVDEARARLESTRVTEEQTRQQVELDVRNAYLTLGDAADQLRSALTAQTAAREALRIANVRFQAGVGTQLEVVTAVQNSSTADNGVVQAQFQYNLALALLDRATGVQVKL
jgi:outer membrane protein